MLDILITDINEKFPIETHNLCKIFIEKEARENILAYLINNSSMDSPEYTRLWLEYLDFIVKSQKARKEYYDNVIVTLIPEEYKNKNIFWSIEDFDKGDLRIYE